MATRPGGHRYFQGHTAHREPMGAYEANDHIARLQQEGGTPFAYARRHGIDFRTFSEAIREHRPELADELLTGAAAGTEARKRGASLETSAKGMLERRGYYVVKSYASKSPLDMLAVHREHPALMVQAKRSGKIGSREWNELFDLADAHGCWPVLVARPAGEDKGAVWYRLRRRREFREGQAGLMDEFDPRHPEQQTLLA